MDQYGRSHCRRGRARSWLVPFDSADVRDRGNAEKSARTQIDLIRKDMCLNYVPFITGSFGHLSKYLPYYRKIETGRALLRQSYDGGSRF